MSETIVVAVIGGIATVVGAWMSARKPEDTLERAKQTADFSKLADNELSREQVDKQAVALALWAFKYEGLYRAVRRLMSFGVSLLAAFSVFGYIIQLDLIWRNKDIVQEADYSLMQFNVTSSCFFNILMVILLYAAVEIMTSIVRQRQIGRILDEEVHACSEQKERANANCPER